MFKAIKNLLFGTSKEKTETSDSAQDVTAQERVVTTIQKVEAEAVPAVSPPPVAVPIVEKTSTPKATANRSKGASKGAATTQTKKPTATGTKAVGSKSKKSTTGSTGGTKTTTGRRKKAQS